MWIKIDNHIFDDADFSSLNNLLSHLVYNPIDSIFRYNVLVDLPKIEFTNLFKKLPEHLREILRQEYNVFGTASPKIKYTITNTRAINNFTIEEGLRIFKEPVVILLENNKNDAHFVECITSFFGQRDADGLNKIEEHLANGWLTFDNAGGCSNVKNFIDGKLTAYNRLALKNGRSNFEYYRAFVLLDSDREYATQPLKNQYIDLQSYLSTIRISGLHILEKRMMENYIPDEVIFDLTDAAVRPWISVYKTLTPKQKDYLNYKSGFSKENDNHGKRKILHPEILALYNLSSHNFNIIDGGLVYQNFKTTFPLLFKSGRVNKYTLKSRANSMELEKIVAKIEEII